MNPATLAVGVALGVPFVALTSLRTKVLVYFAVLPLVGWLKIRFPSSSAQGIPDILAAVLAVQVGWELVVRKARLPVRHPLVLLAGAFALIAALQARNPIARAAGVGNGDVRVFLVPLALFAAGLLFWQRPNDGRRFLRVVVVTSLVVGAYMLKQLLLGLDGHEHTYFVTHAASLVLQEKKLFSTTLAPDVYGFVSAFFVLACLTARAVDVWPRLSLLAAALSAVGVVTSGVRVAVVALAAGLVVLVGVQLRDERTRLFATRVLVLGVAAAVVLVAIVAITPAPADRRTVHPGSAWASAVDKLALLKEGRGDPDVQSRLDRTGRFIAYVHQHPWGTGPGITSLVQFDTDACLRTTGPCFQLGGARANLPAYVLDEPFIFQHDFFYFSATVELGVLAVALLIVVLLGAALLGWRLARRGGAGPAVEHLAGLAAATTVLALVHTFTNESFRTPQVAGVTWFLVSAPVALGAFSLRRRPAPASAPPLPVA